MTERLEGRRKATLAQAVVPPVAEMAQVAARGKVVLLAHDAKVQLEETRNIKTERSRGKYTAPLKLIGLRDAIERTLMHPDATGLKELAVDKEEGNGNKPENLHDALHSSRDYLNMVLTGLAYETIPMQALGV